ncbi:MAG: cytochrome c biogenesis protein CcsA [Planctomycetes bacterium]|nr:cytochrome c biogenesis protein CcsA [Planctomycetota bacterium]
MRYWAVVFLICFPAASFAQTPAPPPTTTTMRSITVQHDGRWMPLDTLARDMVESVTGSDRFGDRTAVETLLDWTFDAARWRTQPLIQISNAQLRAELALPADKAVFSFEELRDHPRLHDVLEAFSKRGGGAKPDPLESKALDISSKLTALERVFAGVAIRVLPDPADANGVWRPAMQAGRDAREQEAAQAWAALRTAYAAHDQPTAGAAAVRLDGALRALPARHRPADATIRSELTYNESRPFRMAWITMAAGAVVAAAAFVLRRWWCDALSVLALLGGFLLLSYGLWLRWQIAGRIPASNMFESLLFLSWGMGAFAILAMIVQRQRLVPLTASAMGALALLLADCLPLDHFVRPIAPVLMDTVWMSIHVPIIMVSYSVLALGVLIAHGLLVVLAVAPLRSQLIARLDALHYWYIHVGSILLFIGIVTGSMWAASSWGRYWGWDPKEVWSLVAFLGYMAILHVRIDRERVARPVAAVAAVLIAGTLVLALKPLLSLNAGNLAVVAGLLAAMAVFLLARGTFATAVKSILAFWLILMTYLGVNFVLGTGLHSYGFGTGAVVRYMFLTGSIDLGLIGLCSAVYLLRRAASAHQQAGVAVPA